MRDGLITVNAILKEFFSLHLNEFAVKRNLIRIFFLGYRSEKTTSKLNREIILSMLDDVSSVLDMVGEKLRNESLPSQAVYYKLRAGFGDIYNMASDSSNKIKISSVVDSIIDIEAEIIKYLFHGVGRKNINNQFNSHRDSDVSMLTNSSSSASIIARKGKPKITFHEEIEEISIPKRSRKNRCI